MKIVLVSTLQPDTNYSRYLSQSLAKTLKKNFIVYSDKNPKNKRIKDLNIYNCWNKGFSHFFEILNQLYKDPPNVVHFQQEMNMYGNPYTTGVFPFLILLSRLLGVRTIVTIHAVVPKNIINRNFVNSFVKRGVFIPTFLLKIYFDYLYFFTALFASRIIVHTKLLKKYLVHDYHVSSRKIVVIPHGVANIKYQNNKISKSQNFFLYFGYIAKRKGLDSVVVGFSKFVKKYPQFKLVLAGGIINGQEFAQEELKKIVKDLKQKKHIIFTNFIDKNKINNLYKKAYCVVCPAVMSISASGPMALGFAYKKCILASRIGNFNEEIVDGKTGILVDHNKWEVAFEKIAKNKSLKKSVEKNVAKVAMARDWDNIAKLHIKIYG